MNFTSRILKKYALKTFQHLLTAKSEKPEEQVQLFRSNFELFALHILTANKQENLKDVKVLFKELFHCMRVTSETNSELFANPAKLQTCVQLMNHCL